MEQITKDIEVSPGVVSLMRKSVKFTIQVGTFMIVSGIVMAAYSLFKNRGFELISFYSLLTTSGAAMITGALASKAWQSNAEAKENNILSQVSPPTVRSVQEPQELQR